MTFYSSSYLSPVTVTREIAMGYVSATTGAVAVSVGMNRAVNVRWKLSANKALQQYELLSGPD